MFRVAQSPHHADHLVFRAVQSLNGAVQSLNGAAQSLNGAAQLVLRAIL